MHLCHSLLLSSCQHVCAASYIASEQRAQAQTDLRVNGMSNGIRLDRLAGMRELLTVLREVVCQGRYVLPLEDVPHSPCPTIPTHRQTAKPVKEVRGAQADTQ